MYTQAAQAPVKLFLSGINHLQDASGQWTKELDDNIINWTNISNWITIQAIQLIIKSCWPTRFKWSCPGTRHQKTVSGKERRTMNLSLSNTAEYQQSHGWTGFAAGLALKFHALIHFEKDTAKKRHLNKKKMGNSGRQRRINPLPP